MPSYRLVSVSGGGEPLSAASSDPAAASWTAYHEDGMRLVEHDTSEAFLAGPGCGFWVQGALPLSE